MPNVAKAPWSRRAGCSRRFFSEKRRHVPAEALCGGVATFREGEVTETARRGPVRGCGDVFVRSSVANRPHGPSAGAWRHSTRPPTTPTLHKMTGPTKEKGRPRRGGKGSVGQPRTTSSRQPLRPRSPCCAWRRGSSARRARPRRRAAPRSRPRRRTATATGRW